MGGYGRYGPRGWESRDARQIKKVSELPGYEVALLNAVVQLLAEYVVEFLAPKWVEEVNAARRRWLRLANEMDFGDQHLRLVREALDF